MCLFISLVTDSPDAELLKKALGIHGKDAIPMINPSIHRLLKEQERQFRTGAFAIAAQYWGTTIFDLPAT